MNDKLPKLLWSPIRDFKEINIGSMVPRRSGIYLLLVKPKNSSLKVFYVGQTMDLKKRLLQHLSPDEQNSCIKNRKDEFICGYTITEITYQSDRDRIEKFLFDYYEPECNEYDPGGNPIEVNLPK